MRHKHADVIHAWAEGAEVEYLAGDGRWLPCAHTPQWWKMDVYRVKPAAKIVKYRKFMTEDGRIGVSMEGDPPPPDFTGWLEGWKLMRLPSPETQIKRHLTK